MCRNRLMVKKFCQLCNDTRGISCWFAPRKTLRRMSSQAWDVFDQLVLALNWLCQVTCWSLSMRVSITSLVDPRGGPWHSRFERIDGQFGCPQLSATPWIASSWESGQLLALFRIILQSTTMVSHQVLCASLSWKSRLHLLKRRLIRSL